MIESDLLRRVLASPEDDAPRRDYAELLSKRGDPRGEFIKIQLRIAEIHRDHGRTAGTRAELATLTPKQRSLLALYGDEWSAPAYPVPYRECTFYRGFVEVVDMHAGSFAELAEELYRRVPILHVELDGGEAAGLEQLCRSPAAARIISFGLYGNPVGDAGARAIAASPYVGRLAWLDLRNTGVTREGVEALAASSNLGRLRWVELGLNDVPNPVDQPDEVDGDDIVHWCATAYGKELEARHGHKEWLHYQADSTMWYPPSRQAFDGAR